MNPQALRIERKRTARAGAKRVEAKGRTLGVIPGSWVTDLAELRQSLLLCWSCDAKWKRVAHRYGYEIHRRWARMFGGVTGKCDGCREPGMQRRFYLHESNRGQV